MRKFIALLAGVVMVMGVVATQAQATLWSLNESNVPLGVNGDYVTVNIDVVGNAATFTVDANEALLGAGPNFGLDKFFFYTNLGNSITIDDLSGPSTWALLSNKTADGFGIFGLEYKGTGGTRQDPLSFTITDASITSPTDFYVANALGHHFAAHVGSFGPLLGQDSAFFTDGGTPPPPPIPEPGTMMLLGVGLFGLAVYGKRRMIKE